MNGSEPAVTRAERYSISVSRETHELLLALRQSTGRTISGVVHALLNERDMNALTLAITQQKRLRNRGAKRKYFHA